MNVLIVAIDLGSDIINIDKAVAGTEDRDMDYEQFYLELGRRLRQARTAARLTQAELADRANMTRPALANIERGEQRMAAHQLVAVATALGIEPATLLPKADSLADRVEHALQEAGLPPEVANWGAKAAERLAHRGDEANNDSD